MKLAPDEAFFGDSPLQADKPSNTSRTYKSAWRNFEQWCGEKGATSLPACSSAVENYLRDLMNPPAKSLSTARTYLAAIAAFHRQAGYPDPTNSPEIKAVFRRLASRHDYGGVYTQTQGITDELLNPILAELEDKIKRTSPDKPSWFKAKRDYALFLVMRNGLLRSSEAAELRWGDVTILEDGSAFISLVNAKDDEGDQDGLVPIGQRAIEALEALRDATDYFAARFAFFRPTGSADDDQPVFELSARQISRRIKQAATDAGLHDRYSGNSLRVGMAQDLSVDYTIRGLMGFGRWSSPVMPSRYSATGSATKPPPRWLDLPEDGYLSGLSVEDQDVLLDYLAAHGEISSKNDLDEAEAWMNEPYFDVTGPILTTHEYGDHQYQSLLARARMWRDRYREGYDAGYDKGFRDAERKLNNPDFGAIATDND